MNVFEGKLGLPLSFKKTKEFSSSADLCVLGEYDHNFVGNDG